MNIVIDLDYATKDELIRYIHCLETAIRSIRVDNVHFVCDTCNYVNEPSYVRDDVCDGCYDDSEFKNWELDINRYGRMYQEIGRKVKHEKGIWLIPGRSTQ